MSNLLSLLVALFRTAVLSRTVLQMENLALRQQLAILKRTTPTPRLRLSDRLFWVILSRLWSGWRDVLVFVKPETVIGWHRLGFRLFWRWASRRRKAGRPAMTKDVRDLIRRMCEENPLWGAPRIHGELLKLGIKVSEATVSRILARLRPRKPPSQTWRTFLDNHADCLASIDFFVVPTATFRLLYGFLVLTHDRRRIVHFGVTANPTSAWVARQLREAFPWEIASRFLLRDNDRIYGPEFRATLTAMGIDDVPTAPRSP